MPFAFPSHQGLIAPLWRRWPRFFDMPALCVGAAMPDVVDGIHGAFQGHLGQGAGHSFLGLFAFCLPGGLILWYGLHAVARRAPRPQRPHWFSYAWNTGMQAIADTPGSGELRQCWGTVFTSLWIGVFSHVFFDFISHGGTKFLWPWIDRIKVFPNWWNHEWFRMPIPGYTNGYLFSPHFIVWCFLGILGAWMLFKPLVRPKGTPEGRGKEDPSGITPRE